MALSRIDIDQVISRALPYIINTLFDAVFTILGIVVGSAFGSAVNLRVIIGTIITASISLGTSSGFSVYEAETIQEEKRIDEIEEALISDLENTMITELSRSVTLLSALLIFLTPIFVCVLTILPFVLVYLDFTNIGTSAIYAVIIDLLLIFIFGYVFGGGNRLLKGLRMTFLGAIIFVIGYILSNWI